jgi:ATP-dependent Clp endopeptidase proteolytic subunit ClpP
MLEDLRAQRLRILTAQADLEEAKRDEELKKQAFINNADVRNRVLPFTGKINDESADQAVDILSRWSRRDASPITVVFNSPGGEVISGFLMYDKLRSFSQKGVKINTVVYGMAASMAAVLLQAGDERIIAPHAFILMHEGSVNAEDGFTASISQFNAVAKNQKKFDDAVAELLSERSGKLTATEIRRKYAKGDWVLDAKDTVKYGFADRIGSE